MSVKVGQDIESICGKCGDVWHVVVAMKGNAVAKVQCKQCNGYHRHRPPDGVKTSSASKPAGRAGSTRKKRTATTRKKEPDAPLCPADPSRPPREYRISESYTPGDTLEHKTFGTGVVELALEDGKIQVYFPDTRRVLAHQR